MIYFALNFMGFALDTTFPLTCCWIIQKPHGQTKHIFRNAFLKLLSDIPAIFIIDDTVSVSNLYACVYFLQELSDVPLFLSLHNLCATLKCTSPSAVIFRSAVINAGYRISGTHVNPLGLKSDAPMDVIWDIMRCWVTITQPI